MNKKVKKVIEDLGWTVHHDNCIEIWTDCAGQDVCIECNEGESLKETIRNYYDSYDIDEEVKMFLEANANGFQGVPEPTILVQDCEEVLNKLEELWFAVKDLPNF